MAWQHLYARVPSKLSMFNKTDGYDTFACSAGVTEEFAVKELSYVCDIKITPDVSEDIRSGRLSPVYSQFAARDGHLVQSCVTFLPLDYTGERSTYMVHSIISESPEYTEYFSNYDGAAVNKDIFLHDLSVFRLTDPSSKPDREYPDIPLVSVHCETQNWVAETLDRDLLRRFMYSVFAAVSGKIKCVYVALKDTGEQATEGFIRLINSLFKVIPYHLRPLLSFATRVMNTSQFSGVKLKGVVADIDSIKASKCAAFDFSYGSYVGVKDEDVNDNIVTVDFICSLFRNDLLRRVFLAFTDRVVKASPSLGASSFGAVNDLVRLFRCGCGFYEEKSVLPNDIKVLELLTVYENHRRSLPDDYRVNIMRCINRYPAARIEIPKKIFNKLQKMYPNEIPGTKHVIMNAVLDLIHTDAMRDKLFAFIKSNYVSESPAARSDMIRHLCNVFYGGFLQPQLLAFFDDCFSGASEESRAEIVSKVLLAIRTKSLIDKIIAFLDDHYVEFTPELRSALYDALLEEIPEGDDLAFRLICFADCHLTDESDDFIAAFDKRLVKAICAEQNRAKHPLIIAISKTGGHCSEAAAKYVFKECAGQKIYNEYFASMLGGSFESQHRCILYAAEFCNVDDDGIATDLADRIAACMLASHAKQDLEVLVSAADEFENSGLRFLSLVAHKAVCPLISSRITDVFNGARGTLTVEDINELAMPYPEIAKDGKFKIIENYLEFKKAFLSAGYDEFMSYCESFPSDKELRADIGAYAEKDLASALEVSDHEKLIAYCFAVSYLKTGSLGIHGAYDMLLSAKADAADSAVLEGNALYSAKSVIDFCISLDSDAFVSGRFRSLLTEPDSGLYGMLDQIVSTYGKKAAKRLESMLREYGKSHAEFAAYCKSVIRRKRNGSGSGGSVKGFFSKSVGFFKRQFRKE